jgi:hypothetical protein
MDREFLLSFKLTNYQLQKVFRHHTYKTQLFSFISDHASDIVSISFPQKESVCIGFKHMSD